jgi:2-polyprenyl-6-methoxyphenol hydroxylase-like FAD-dependent oxidoreductase
MQKRVCIVGAGIGGLNLAQGLKRRGIPFNIVERDPARNWRPQGYRLRIDPQMGDPSLKKVLSPEHFKVFQDSCAITTLPGQALDALTAEVSKGVLMGPAGRTGNVSDVYTADRLILRSVLMAGLEDEIKFGWEFDNYEIQGSKIRANFKNGSSLESDLLIGADGDRSRVRKQFLPIHQILDTDGRAIYGKTLLTPELEKLLPPAMQDVACLTGTESPLVNIFSEPVRLVRGNISSIEKMSPNVASTFADTKDYVYWVLCSRTENLIAPNTSVPREKLLSQTGESAARLSLEVTKDWHPSIRKLLEEQIIEQSAVIRISSAHPNIAAWNSNPNITVLGDAIHRMSPAAGAGANTALFDAATLLDMIDEKGVSLEAIEEYEKRMREYASKNIMASQQGGSRIFGQPPFDQCRPLENQ